LIASMSIKPKNYDEHFEKMVRAVRISTSRNKGLEGVLKEIKNINQKVTSYFSLSVFSIFQDFYEEILNNNVPFETRRDLDSRMVACYYAGRIAGQREGQKIKDPEERLKELYDKYTKARDIAKQTLRALLYKNN
ncbi:MAG: hypothetical protein QXR96_02945, partial [Candidatus Woesearchaeota archaeon]